MSLLLRAFCTQFCFWPLYAPLLKFLVRRSISKLFESYIPTTCVEQILDLLLIPLIITIPSKDLAAAKAIERAATHRISKNFIILSTKKRFYQVRFLCAQTGRDLRRSTNNRRKDVVKILQNISETSRINYVNQCLNNISTKKKKLKSLCRKFSSYL